MTNATEILTVIPMKIMVITMKFVGSTLTNANFGSSDLYRTIFSWADLSGASLDHASGRWASFLGADLSTASLFQADLPWAAFNEANLTNANLAGANLKWADLSGADLTGANLLGTDLTRAFANSETVWPTGFVPFLAGVVTWVNQTPPMA